MTIEDLKKRATASEITLIEMVEASLQKEIYQKTLDSFFEFCNANPPLFDTRENPRESMNRWVVRLNSHMNP